MKNKISVFTALLLMFSLSLFAQITYTYTGKPIFQILTKRNNAQLGIIKVELFPNIAPHHTRNFDSLVSKKFYDTTAFHRVIPGFMIQGGDPNSRHGPTSTWGYGQPGQPTVVAEFSSAKHLRGILSAARLGGTTTSAYNSATSQFFICVAPQPQLDGKYSIYGRVLSGMDVVDTIVSAPRDPVYNRPYNKIEMYVTYIGSNDTVPVSPVLQYPPKDTTNMDTLSNIILKWKKVNDGIIYHIDIANDPVFTNIISSGDVGTLQYTLSDTLLLPLTKYYWRVRTNNGGHFSPWSSTWNFKMSGVSTVGVVNNLWENKITVYPNPGSGIFYFSGLRENENLEVFDINSRKVFSRKVSSKNCVVDLSHFEKGIYFYKITPEVGKFIEGKLILK